MGPNYRARSVALIRVSEATSSDEGESNVGRRNYHERPMPELTFTYGTMAAGKSTLALQLCWQLRQGRSDVALWTFGDRSDEGMVTSRIGIEAAAEAIHPGASLEESVESLLASDV